MDAHLGLRDVRNAKNLQRQRTACIDREVTNLDIRIEVRFSEPVDSTMSQQLSLFRKQSSMQTTDQSVRLTSTAM